MRILAIETSCDDTGITIFEAKDGTQNAEFKILADNLASQVKIHNQYGGGYPILAKREHEKNLPILLKKTFREAGFFQERSLGRSDGDGQRKFLAKNFRAESVKKSSFIDLICVTYGPGLEMCLWEGITFAKDLARGWGVPLVPVNHMEGHVLSVFGKNKGKFKVSKLKTPVLSLLVSGGHTQLVLSKKFMKYEIIGETLDDAVGEAFDKVARMLDLPYPGGPHISRLAEQARKSETRNSKFEIKFPRPMLNSNNFDFSYAGLKTAVLYFLKKNPAADKARVALEFENAAIECLTYKTARAIEKYKIKTLIVAGGVAANKHLRREMTKITSKKIKLLFPTLELARDNAVMIGIAGYLNFLKNKKKVPRQGSIKATGNLRL